MTKILANPVSDELLPGEDPDLRAESTRMVGTEWLSAKNVALGGKTPEQLIGTPDEPNASLQPSPCGISSE